MPKIRKKKITNAAKAIKKAVKKTKTTKRTKPVRKVKAAKKEERSLHDIPLFDMSVVRRFHGVELLIISYEQELRAKKTRLQKDHESMNQDAAFNWFIFAESVNQQYNYLSETITQERHAKAIDELQAKAWKERLMAARDDFYVDLYKYYDRSFDKIGRLAKEVHLQFNRLMQDYFELIHHNLKDMTPMGVETLIRKRREVENYLGSDRWLGKYSKGDPAHLLDEMEHHEKEARKAIKKVHKVEQYFEKFADDLLMSAQEREVIKDALGVKLPKVGPISISK